MLINGSMKEARDRRVVWDDIDEETFVAFSQFAYTAHYDTPEHPTSLPEPEGIGEAKPSCISRSEKFDSFCRRSKRTILEWEQDFKAKLNLKREAYLAIYSIFLEFVVYADSDSQCFNESLNISACSFLFHARLYVLADRYCINTLKEMALGKLHRALLLVPLDLYASDCFCELVRFAYTNTRTTKGFGQCELRSLLVTFGACTFDWFIHNSAFNGVLRDHGEFGLGILTKLSSVQNEVYRVVLSG
ncbi:hypothetical protein DL764_010522 [Monosporascus ibericus]|uniref:BTB domain-containing protein n=1 Tax=Monosporascus ibericus TaxID=155417 RepID=A0A4Q4SV82_9PEZI|nr:hypothetical protein DL764_010522 [Monosporascus ibericus]